jgi:hypothetical protein
MKIWQSGLLAAMLPIGLGAAPPVPLRAAIFGFAFDDTSLQGELQGKRPDEQLRLTHLDAQLKDLLTRSGCCTAVDLAAVADRARNSDLQACGACALDMARQVGAQIAVTGWVQKVSDLILNINAQIRDSESGRVLSAGSVDIRGNTDESWSHGLAYLVRNRLLTPDWEAGR